jgi:hypothetical protein
MFRLWPLNLTERTKLLALIARRPRDFDFC